MKSLKQVISIIAAIAKAKSMAVKSKTSTIKTRFTLYKLLHDKKLLTGITSTKFHAVKTDEKVKNHNNTAICYKPTCTELVKCLEEEEEEEYTYFTNQILELGLDDEDCNRLEGGSAPAVDSTCSQEDGSEFILENEVDKAADVFIRRFHKQMQIQKQESFKRYQEMLKRSI